MIGWSKARQLARLLYKPVPDAPKPAPNPEDRVYQMTRAQFVRILGCAIEQAAINERAQPGVVKDLAHLSNTISNDIADEIERLYHNANSK